MNDKLINAVYANDINKVRELVAAGADINKEDEYGETSLKTAVYLGKIDMIRILVKELGADINKENRNGQIPLITAVSSGKLDMVRFLVKELGADINKENRNGQTPLNVAVSYGKIDMVRFLVRFLVKELGADINQEDKNGQTPLNVAIMNNKIDVVTFLLKELGADINKIDVDGNTLLMLKVKNFNYYNTCTPLDIDMIKLLVESDIDINVKNKAGKTAYSYARCNPKILEVLKEAGAIVENFDEEHKLLYLSHLTSLDNIYKILEAGKIYTDVDMWYKNFYTKGYTDKKSWRPPYNYEDKYPGVYMSLNNNDSIGEPFNTDYGYNKICLIFCVSLLNYGIIDPYTSFNMSELQNEIKTNCITGQNEVIFHHAVSLKYLKEIWVTNKDIYTKVEHMLKKNSMNVPIKITDVYLDKSQTCEEPIKKLKPNYCILPSLTDIDNIEFVKKLARECGLTDIDDPEKISELLSKPIFSTDITIEGIKEYLKSKGVSDDTIENLSEGQLKELKDINLVDLNFLKNYSRFDGGKEKRKKSGEKKSKSKRKKLENKRRK